jgi:DNA-binding CsgD family transcriptional regulator
LVVAVGSDEDSDGSGDGLMLSCVDDVIVISAPLPRLPAILTESERAVARALLTGCSNAEIARARGTSRKTISNQLSMMYRKLGVENRERLVGLLVSSSTGLDVNEDDPPQS